jgi:peptidoglycan/LPS O-acetylase OafA/YrhL
MNNHLATTTRERVEEAAREIGVLLIAFAPLDVALNDARPFRWWILLLFLSLGLLFFVCALVAERRRKHRA